MTWLKYISGGYSIYDHTSRVMRKTGHLPMRKQRRRSASQ